MCGELGDLDVSGFRKLETNVFNSLVMAGSWPDWCKIHAVWQQTVQQYFPVERFRVHAPPGVWLRQTDRQVWGTSLQRFHQCHPTNASDGSLENARERCSFLVREASSGYQNRWAPNMDLANWLRSLLWSLWQSNSVWSSDVSDGCWTCRVLWPVSAASLESHWCFHSWEELLLRMAAMLNDAKASSCYAWIMSGKMWG